MKKVYLLSALFLILGAGLMGCQNTAEGAKEDTAQNTAKVQSAADKAAASAKDAADQAAVATEKAAKNTSAALEVTPKVKNAIVADSQLNDTRNLINVDSADNVVHLKGHVINSAMKKRAGETAEKTLHDMNATDKVSNELTVQPQ